MHFYDLKLLEESSAFNTYDKIALYGAGFKGNEIRQLFNYTAFNIWCFIDADGEKEAEIHKTGVAFFQPQQFIHVMENNRDIVYLIACIENPEEVWSMFNGRLNDNIRFISYFGIKQFFYQYGRYMFEKHSVMHLRRDVEDALRMNQIERSLLNKMTFFLDGNEYVWNIQAGKTGSTTIQEMLGNAGIPAIHGHSITFPDWGNAKYKEIWDSAVKQKMEQKIKVICLVRNPLDRDYSTFWQPFSSNNPRIILHSEATCLQEKYDSFIENTIMRNVPEEVYGRLKPATWHDEFYWFDREIKSGLGIDVYNHPFDKETGYTIISEGKIEVFLGKLELLEDYIDALGDFVGAELKMVKANAASKKWYSMTYKAFRKHVQIDRKYVMHYLEGNPRVDHFYTHKEKSVFYQEWENNIKSD